MTDWPRILASGTTTMHLGDRTGAGEVPNLAQLRFFDEWAQLGQQIGVKEFIGGKSKCGKSG
jgi:hypothetical protein